MPHSVLILMAETGGGHRSASIALREAFEALAPGRWEVHFIDIFSQILPFPFDRLGNLYRPMVSYTPWLWSALWHLGESSHVRRGLELFFAPLTRSVLLGLLERYHPQVVISVHQLANHVPVRVFKQAGWDGVFATVVTDLISLHPLWLNPEVDLCIVPTEEAEERALQMGIPRSKVKLLGFPVSLRFCPEGDKRTFRRELGLREEVTTLLLVGGGEGMGRMLEVARAINEARLPVQLLAVAGWNERLRHQLESMDWEIPHRIYGFVEDMPRLMKASDVILTKAGPSTICEAMTAGLPIILFDYVPGQEEGNVRFVEGQGLGVFAPEPEEVVSTLQRWLEEPTEMEAIRSRARKLADPQASRRIVATIAELLYT